MTLPGSVIMMRRHDVDCGPYFVATPQSMQPARNGSSDANGNKTKKSWGERLKIGGNKTKDEDTRVLQHQQQQQQQQQMELANNNYLLHEYRNKYGTLSNGSALSKSMKYAETWLYGSVRQPNQSRGNVLHYQHPSPSVAALPPTELPRPTFHPTLIPHITMCSCKEFIGGTVRSKKNTSSTGICNKCGGSRMPWRGGGTLRATVRINDANRMGGTVRVGQSRVRPSLMNINPNMKTFTPDPYDLMRRNRMGVVGDEEVVNDRTRAKSTSPGRHNIRRSPSPPVTRHLEARRGRSGRSDRSWETDFKRKSILECDVNPYQLIAKYLKNGEMVEEPADNMDDELSDDMGDNVMETVVNCAEPKVKKAEVVEKVKGVTLGGQRMKVFNSSLEADYVNDDVNDEPELEEVPQKHSMIPRLHTPKRPQRRVKSLEGVTKKDEEMESVRSSLNSQIERRSHLVSSNIKSILKKPSALPGGIDTTSSTSSLQPSTTFNDTDREPDATAAQSLAKTRVASSSDFYLPTFHEYKREIRKKKQVQFNDTVDNNVVNDLAATCDDAVVNSVVVNNCEPSEVDNNVIQVTFKVVSEIPTEASSPVRLQYSSEIPTETSSPVRLQYFGDHLEDVVRLSQDKDNTMPPTVTQVWRDKQLHHDMESLVYRDEPHAGVPLRRSLSDRQVVSGEESKQEQTAALFNDTMRLRLLSGRRTDSRQAFSHPGASLKATTTKTKRVLSPGRPRPKEPPPPPPLPTPVPVPQDQQVEEKKQETFKITFQKHEPAETIKTVSPKQLKLVIPSKVEVLNVPATPNVVDEVIPTETEVKQPEDYTIPFPPQLPPRHIFPFTKKQIQNINNQKRHKSLKSSPGSPPLVVMNMRSKTRPNSCIPQINSLSPGDTGLVHNASRIRHRNSDPGPAMATVNFRLPDTSEPEVNEGVRTVVSVCPDSPDVHRLQIKTDAFPSRRTSILINGDDYETPVMTTSVIIDDKKDSNKVTISVGGVSNGTTTWANMNNSINTNNNSCTIIDTHGNNSLTRMNHTNQIIIPVSPEPVYNQRSNVQVDDHDVMIVDRTTGKSLGTQHDYEVLEMLMDPVEAVRMHLVPHVCGKINPDGGANLVSTSAMERLNSLLVEQKGYLESDTSIVETSSPESSLTDVNKYAASEKNSLEVTSDQENNGISVHYFTAPRFMLNDEHVDDDEKVADKDIYDDAENIYESIKDPIYEEIGLPDTPPPLPLSPPPSLDDLDDKRTSRSIFEGASKYDILNYLVDAKERGYVESDYNNGIVLDSKDTAELTSLGDLSSRVSNLSNGSDSSEDSTLLTTGLDKDGISRKSSADIERNDSGVGSETSKSSRSRWQNVPVGIIREDQIHLCEDCDQHVETQVTDSGVMYAPLVCRKCSKKRAERKDTIAEIVETEEKYGGDLRIILEEFYRPMLVAGLLTSEQLTAIFLNVEELIENNAVLAEKLRDALEIALEQGDEDLLTVNIGSLFLEAAPMLHAFESYCTRQGGASLLLANLEKEKELLRIFLRVSQMENAVLRRMNLNSFLMVPVQRVTKYPLLLARLHKVTPGHHPGRDLLKQAQHNIELHLEHMNSVAKDISTTKLWRRISIVNGRRSSSEIDMINIKLRKMAVDVLEWNHDEVKFAMEGRMLYTNPTDNNWRKGRTIKLNPINALLVTNGKPTEDYRPEDELLLFPRKTGVREATLLLVKEKCGRYSMLRDPLYLDKCIVCCETDWEDYFEVQELASKDTFIFKAEDSERTKLWYRQLQYHSQGLGAWRRRRNALANIMINGMMTRN